MTVACKFRMQHVLGSVLFTVLFLDLTSVIVAKPTQNEAQMDAIDNAIEGGGENIIANDDNEYRAKYAKMMMTYMNQSVDPCQDFYEYACGNWKNVIEERQAQHKRSNLLDIAYRLEDIVAQLLERPAEDLQFEYKSEWKLAQQFYQSCLQADLHPVKESQEYLEVINMIGGFPAVDEAWDADNFDWFNMSAHLSVYGAAGLTKEEITPQYPFPPYFKLPDLGFDYIVQTDNIASNTSRGYSLNEKRMREYLLAYGVDEANSTQIIGDIFDFWRAVLNVSDQIDANEDLCQKTNFTKWDNYFDIVWQNKAHDDCPCEFFYTELDRICNENKEPVANYLAMKFLYHMDARLNDKSFQKEYCVMNIQNSLVYVIDRLYLMEYFNEDIRQEVTTIITELRKSLQSILEEADWLDDVTRTEAFLKESTITTRIGNFKDLAMSDRLIREMNNLTYVEGNYEKNNLNLKKFKMLMKRYIGLHHEELKNDTKPLELLVAMQVNAFYYNVDNSINVMAGILHPPAYHKAWPNSLKYGTLGYLIGHEFTHGFDSVGAYFDSTGESRYWWSNKSGKVFDERADCYVAHYDNYTIPEINRNINGNVTKDENIADSGGLREALSAYHRYIKELSKDAEPISVLKVERMPGLDLSPEQLFFVGFAQLWCASYKEEHYWEELTNEHTVDKYRVLGAVTNIEDFAKAYNCSMGSKMHPNGDKCRLW